MIVVITIVLCVIASADRRACLLCRNMCLSLQPGCDKRSLLLLWQHECHWVYGRRMVSEVDIRRFRQAFITAVRKQFIDDDLVMKCICSVFNPPPPRPTSKIDCTVL